MNAIYRLLPLLMFVCLCLMLWQYVAGVKDGILDFLAAIRWYLLAAFFLMLALLRAVWLHAHDRALEESIADSLIQAKERGYDTIELKREDGKVKASMRRSNPAPSGGQGAP